MRSVTDVEKGIQVIENRIDRDAEHMEDDPLAGMVMSIHQAKRAALQQIDQSDNGEHWEMYDNLVNSLNMEMSLVEYAQTQAMVNAHEWAQEEFDTL